MRGLFLTAALIGLICVPTMASAEIMSLEQAVVQVRTVNPQVRGARYRWEAAKHQIIQNYTPADPQFLFSNQDSWKGFLAGSGLHNMTVTQSLQFPGKGLLQGRTAERASERARLTYMAAIRDVTAQTKTAYYQNQLDLALNDLIIENVTNLERVLKVTQIAYTASLATQGEYINAKFALEADRELLRQQAVTIANDKTALNILLDRRPDEPLQVDPKFDLTSFEASLDQVIERAVSNRQEILQAALTEKNQDAAVTLAHLEYAPDYTVGFGLDHWLIASFRAEAGSHRRLELSDRLQSAHIFLGEKRRYCAVTPGPRRREGRFGVYSHTDRRAGDHALSPDSALTRDCAPVSQHSHSSRPPGIRGDVGCLPERQD